MDNAFDPVVFQPKGGIPGPLLLIIIIVVAIGAFGIIRSMKAGGGASYIGLFGLIGLVIIGVVYFAVKSQSSAKPITVYSDRIDLSSYSIRFDQIRSVRLDQVSGTQYTGSRAAVSSQKALTVETPDGPQVIAYEANYDLEPIRQALEDALRAYRNQ
jgi:hypothetical protein